MDENDTCIIAQTLSSFTDGATRRLGMLLVPRTEHHLSSLKCGFLNIFCAKTCCVVCHAYCFCYGGTNMARKNV